MTLLDNPALAADELLRRRRARSSLIGFTEYTKPDFRAADHHRWIADALEKVERGEIKRLMLFMPPRHGKSELASRRFPAWYLGRNPDKQLITATYSTEFAEDFGRDVREIVRNDDYRNVFKATLAADSTSRGRWRTAEGGVYFAVGVGGPITGRGAHLALIDDPVKNRQDAESETLRESTWHWYTSTLRTRMMPGGAIVLICCMSGDTQVLMADGTEKPLSEVRVGDSVASYELGHLAPRKVLNWVNHGPDNVYEIRTTYGTVKANERHPFLVDRDGQKQWIRVRNLRIGDRVVGTGASGAASRADSAHNRRKPEATAIPTTTRRDGQAVTARHPSIQNRVAKRICDIGTALRQQITMLGCRLRAVVAPSAEAVLTASASSSVSIMTMLLGGSEACCAMLATSQSDTAPRLNGWNAARSTSEIISIRECGREDVFDIEVEHTHNFIANGLVSHNTRWHEDDLAGRLLAAQEDGGESWHVISLQALRDEGGEEAALWPAWYPVEELRKIRGAIGPRDWLSLYQQTPTSDEGTFFKREWFQPYKERPEKLNVYMTGDFAVTADAGDFTEIGVWGIDADQNIYALDWYSGQTTTDVWITELLNRVALYEPQWFVAEGGVIRRAVEPWLKKQMLETKTYTACEWLPTSGDKPAMARSFQAMASTGKVHIPLTVWGQQLIDQLMKFPAGKHDDKVDACGLLGRFIAKTWAPTVKPAPKLPSFDEPLRVRDFQDNRRGVR